MTKDESASVNERDGIRDFFWKVSSHDPYPYQVRLAEGALPETLVIPTGFGKTAAVIASWLWKLARDPDRTPRRLIYCLPMRALVEQTEKVANAWVDGTSKYFDWDKEQRPLVQTLLGGEARPRGAPQWITGIHLPAVLIGTQDMLISAALLRGYGVSRFRWPVDFALLHTDALWVFDEVQLAGATLPTSAQLQAWRQDETLFPAMLGRSTRPAQTLWMSATLDPAWLRTVDHDPTDFHRAHDLQADDLNAAHATKLWGAVKRLSSVSSSSSLKTAKEQSVHAQRIVGLIREHLRADGTVLVFLNTVARAQAVYRALLAADIADVVLLHSRFRPLERREATSRALSGPSVIVTTQALEAGVDLTSVALITELAPWSSLVQRIGRCNRYGECGTAGADVLWIDLPLGAEAPYDASALDDARAKLHGLTECGPEQLVSIAPSPPATSAVIRRRDLLDLFDTESDLSGFDVDVSMYVRDANDVDVRIFWRDVPAQGWPEGANAAVPTRDELCPAPIGRMREFLQRNGVRAWQADVLGRRQKAWVKLVVADLRPGLEILIASDAGGYDSLLGFLPGATAPVQPNLRSRVDSFTEVAGLDDDLDAAVGSPVTLARHSRHARDEARTLCEQLEIGEPLRALVIEAALWHDRGKAHAAFQQMLDAAWQTGGELFAKSVRRPKPWGDAGGGTNVGRFKPDPDLRRPRFRHELASSLAYLSEKAWSREADLVAYLIAAHHGKLRMRLRALPEEVTPKDDRLLFARGVWAGDVLPPTTLADETAPSVTLDLDVMRMGEGRYGPSWSARTQALLRTHGPFRLTWLESLVRIADWRASQAEEYATKHGLPPDLPWSPEFSDGDKQ